MGALSLEPVDTDIRTGHCCEFRVVGAGPPAGNPYDPDTVSIDVLFTDPAGKSARMPAFWKQDFTRTLADGRELLQPAGEPGWRVRYTPWTAGSHGGEILLGRDGAPPSPVGSAKVDVTAAPTPPRGYIRVEPEKKRFFQYENGTPMPLLGSNLCWPGARGTYDYDDWLPTFAGAGMNFTRLWMWRSVLGIEGAPGERLNYNQPHAWQLDHVMGLAADTGVGVMLCLDFHGVFQDEKDMWGGNDYWPTHPYNQSQGGPCATQNDFFTNPDARKLYEKRLRYLVGRYGAWPSLMSWEFFNEINNVYLKLKRSDVVRWHGDMADTLHRIDPFRHPVTTSFSGDYEDRRMWEVPALDFTQYHLYCDGVRKELGGYIAKTAQRFSERYGRPMVFGEFGTTYKNDGRALDPNDWCLRQGLWTGLLSGSAGTVMPWWWEGLQTNNRYPLWASLSRFISDTGFGGAAWQPAAVDTVPEPKAPTGPLAPEPGAEPFTAELRMEAGWDDRPAGDLTLRGPEDADAPPLPSFLQGTSHERLRRPFRIHALFGENAAVRVQVDAVSDGAKVAVRADGNTVTEQDIPNKDGKHEVNGEYTDLFIEAPIPAGAHTVELINTGMDWAHLGGVRLSGVLPALGRDLTLGADAFAMTDGSSALLYLVDRRYEYPRGRSAKTPRPCETTLTLKGLADGPYQATWWDPAGGVVTATAGAESRGGALELASPTFLVDTAARIVPAKKP